MEIANFVANSGRKVSPATAEGFRQDLPALKIKVEGLQTEDFPKLRRRLRLLIELFEDVLDGIYTEFPYVAFAEAVFAMRYALKGNDIIPDSVPGLGLADDASIVSAVYIRNEKDLAAYATFKGVAWSEVEVDG